MLTLFRLQYCPIKFADVHDRGHVLVVAHEPVVALEPVVAERTVVVGVLALVLVALELAERIVAVAALVGVVHYIDHGVEHIVAAAMVVAKIHIKRAKTI